MTDQQTWDAVESYIAGKVLRSDEVLDTTLAAGEAAHLPTIAVSPLQGRFLELIARSRRAKRVLEIGTLGGYSTICLARGVGPDGRVVSIECDPRHARVARSSIAAAGLSAAVDVRVGRALDVLPTLSTEAADTFDLVFIDAETGGNGS
jgi:predicted O-methyltransferase YrrM